MRRPYDRATATSEGEVGLAVLPIRVGMAAGAGLGGVIVLAVLIWRGEPWLIVVPALLMAAIVGGFMWLATREQTQEMWSGASVERARVAPRSRGSALAIGLTQGLVLTLVLLILENVLARTLGDLRAGMNAMAAGILLGFALLLTLEIRALLRWQTERDAALHLRAGQPLISWRGSTDALVAVPTETQQTAETQETPAGS